MGISPSQGLEGCKCQEAELIVLDKQFSYFLYDNVFSTTCWDIEIEQYCIFTLMEFY